MESINPISTMIDLCKERNIIIPENVIRIYEENRRNRHLKLDCDEFAYKLQIPTGEGNKRTNMITYLKKIAGKENITSYIPTHSTIERVEKTSNNFKYYQINSRGIRKILMNRNEEYKEYYLTLEDLWNKLNDICDQRNTQLKQQLELMNNENQEIKQQLQTKDEEIQRQNQQLLAAELKFEFLSDLAPIKITGQFIYIWTTKSYALKNIFKIGLTRTTVQQRLEQSGTSLIEEIILLRQFECGDADYLEKQIHSLLNGFRYKQNREFFKLEYSTLLKIVEIITQNNSETVIKVNDIINQYIQTINNGILPELHDDIKKLLDSTDYVRCFFQYIQSKGYDSVELKDVDEKIEEWKKDLSPYIPIGFKSILQKKFKDSNNIIEYKNPQDEDETRIMVLGNQRQSVLRIEKKLKPRVAFILKQN